MKHNTCFTFDNRFKKSNIDKTQIVLLNTNAKLSDYLNAIQLRFFKRYDKIPAFTIAKDGEVYSHYNPNLSANIITDLNSSHIIFVALENLGWLSYDYQNDVYYDWKNNIFEGGVYKKNWRNKEYWDKYTEAQTHELNELLNYLCIEYDIKKTFIGHNTYVVDANEYDGILVRSNYSKQHYDLSPAFNFEKIR